MKRKYEVRWYECNLTEEKRRKFFTEIGARVFALYKRIVTKEKTTLYERNE